MIKIIENITNEDYLKDINQYINKTAGTLRCIQSSITHSNALDDISTKLHKIYIDTVALHLLVSK